MTSFIDKKKDNEVSNKNESITTEELKLFFPPLKKDKGFEYSGKCNYCDVEINFSDISEIKIKLQKNGSRKFSLYHNGCYDRYLRRTID